MNCTLCSTVLTNKKDDYYYTCDTCKAIVKDSRYYLSAEKEKARYQSHNNDVNDLGYQNFTSPITNYVLEHYTSTNKGLDFGSGTGPVISSQLLKNNYDIVPYDPFFTPNTEALKSTYDYIVCCEVVEHFYKPKVEIERLITLLNTNGKLLIMTLLYQDEIDFSNWDYRNDSTHVFIYTKETIGFIAKTYGLKIEVLTDRFIVLVN